MHTLKGDMQRFFHKIYEKVVSSCLLQYKPACVIPRLHDTTGCQTGLTTGCIL